MEDNDSIYILGMNRKGDIVFALALLKLTFSIFDIYYQICLIPHK